MIVLDVADRMAITDAFVLASAPNERQVRAIVEETELRMREAGVKPVRREGERESRWVLLDFGDVVVHVQHAEEREYYPLERLWKDCPELPFAPMRPALVVPAPPGSEPAAPAAAPRAHRVQRCRPVPGSGGHPAR